MAKTKSKRLLCLLLSLAMVFALVITPVYADENDGTDDQEQVQSTDPTEEPTDEETTEEATDEETEEPTAVPTEEETEEPTEEETQASSENSKERLTVTALTAEANTSYVATIGETGYESLAAAVAAVSTEGTETTITLTSDVTESSAVTISDGQSIVLDLGTYTLKLSDTTQFEDTESNKTRNALLVNQGTLTVKNGTITYDSALTEVIDAIVNTGTLDIDSTATIIAKSYAITNFGGTVTTAGNITADEYDAIATHGGTVTINGGVITAENTNNYGSGIDIFGRKYDTTTGEDVAATVTINGGTINANCYGASTNNQRSGESSLNIYGGTINADVGIYWPSAGTITIGSSDSTSDDTPHIVSSGSGIVICCGTLNVYSGTIEATYAADSSTPYNSTTWAALYRANSGAAGLGDAVTVIANRSAAYAAYSLNVNLEGGTYISASNYAVRYANCNAASNSDTDTTQTITVELSGGTYEGGKTTDGTAVGAIDTCEYEDTTNISTLTVTGGTYVTTDDDGETIADTSVNAYVTSGLAVDSDTGEVSTAKVAKIGDIKYTDLADAITAAVSGDTVTLLSNVKLSETINIYKSITLDLGDYTITSSASGKAIYTTQALTITADGGGITADGYAVLNQKGSGYGTLIIDGGTYKSNNDHAVYNLNGSLEIQNGEILSEYSGKAGIYNTSGATVTVSGGSVSGVKYGIYSGGAVNITGGTIEATAASSSYGVYLASGATADISGGTIKGYEALRQQSASDEPSTVSEEGDATADVTISGGSIEGVIHAVNVSTTAVISGGTFTATGTKDQYAVALYSTGAAITVSGGTYSGMYSTAWINSGSNGSITIKDGYCVNTGTLTDSNSGSEALVRTVALAVASIGDTKYISLSDAIEAAESGDTVTLLGDLKSTGLTIESDDNIILDLGGYTLTINSGSIGYTDSVATSLAKFNAGVLNEGTLTIKNGTLTKSSTGYAIVNTGTLYVESDATVSGYKAVANVGGTVSTAGTLTARSTTVETYGGTVEVTAGTVKSTSSQGYAIAIFNRTYDKTRGDEVAAKVIISGGEVNAPSGIGSNNQLSGDSSLTITGGKIVGKYDCIYWPSAGTITIGSEETSTDNTSPWLTSSYGSTIVICCGTLNVYSGTIESTITSNTWSDLGLTAPLDSYDYADYLRSSSGVLGLGDAISIYANRGSAYAEYDLSVNIYGGVLTSESGYAVRYLDSNTTATTTTNQTVTVALEGGSYTGGTGAQGETIDAIDASCVSDDDKGIVYGGSYSTAVDPEYCAEGYAPTSTTTDGKTTYGVTPFYLGVSDDSTKEISASIASGYGTSAMYAKVSADKVGSYSTSAYPTTDATITDSGNSYIFAGWYTLDEDGSYTACTTIPTSEAYAKFVDADVLKVMCYFTPSTVSTSGKGNVWRVVTSWDKLYASAGIEVYTDTTCNIIVENAITKLSYYPSYSVGKTGNISYFYPSTFSSASNYVITGVFYDSTASVTSYTVKAGWQTTDGTIVYGNAYTFDCTGKTTAGIIEGVKAD